MSDENKKVIENLLNIDPRNMSYEQLVSMQNGWWETLNLLSEQNKENKQLKTQLQQKENIIKEVREYVENNLYGDYGYECKQSKKELLEILKGSDKK